MPHLCTTVFVPYLSYIVEETINFAWPSDWPRSYLCVGTMTKWMHGMDAYGACFAQRYAQQGRTDPVSCITLISHGMVRFGMEHPVGEHTI